MQRPPAALPCDKDRAILVKAEDSTDPQYGTNPDHRPIEILLQTGIINIDKPPGPTSHEVTAWVKQILQIEKAGHSGTLDPKVTGVLPVALGTSTKILQNLLGAGKEYICIMHLHDSISQEKAISVTNEFIGPIYQRPPIRSSVKRSLRIRHIYYLNILEFNENDVLFQVGCEAGTYIRKLCFDIGEALGIGAHMRELRRSRVGIFREDRTLTKLYDLLDAYTFWKEEGDESQIRKVIQPVEFIVPQFPVLVVRDSAIDALCHGAGLTAPGVLKVSSDIEPNMNVAILSLKGELIAIGISTASTTQILEANHGIVTRVDSVLMNPGTYPAWKTYKKNQSPKNDS